MDLGDDYADILLCEKYGKNIYFIDQYNNPPKSFYVEYGDLPDNLFGQNFEKMSEKYDSFLFFLPFHQKEHDEIDPNKKYFSIIMYDINKYRYILTKIKEFIIKKIPNKLTFPNVKFDEYEQSVSLNDIRNTNKKGIYILTRDYVYMLNILKKRIMAPISIINLTIKFLQNEPNIYTLFEIDHRKKPIIGESYFIITVPFIKNFLFEFIKKEEEEDICIIPNDRINLVKIYKSDIIKHNKTLYRSLNNQIEAFYNMKYDSRSFRYISNRFKIIIKTKKPDPILGLYMDNMTETIRNHGIGNTILTVAIYGNKEKWESKFQEFQNFELRWITRFLHMGLYYIPKIRPLSYSIPSVKSQLMNNIKNFDLKSELFDNFFFFKTFEEIRKLKSEGVMEVEGKEGVEEELEEEGEEEVIHTEWMSITKKKSKKSKKPKKKDILFPSKKKIKWEEEEYFKFLKTKKNGVNCVVNWLEHFYGIITTKTFYVFKLSIPNPPKFAYAFTKETDTKKKFLLLYQLFLTDKKVKLTNAIHSLKSPIKTLKTTLEKKILKEKMFFGEYLNFKSTILRALLAITPHFLDGKKIVYFQKIINNMFRQENLYDILRDLYGVIGFVYFNKKYLNGLLSNLINELSNLYDPEERKEFIDFFMEPNIRMQKKILEDKLDIPLPIGLDEQGIFYIKQNKERISRSKAQDIISEKFNKYFVKYQAFDEQNKKITEIRDLKGFRVAFYKMFDAINQISIMNDDLNESIKGKVYLIRNELKNDFLKSDAIDNLGEASKFFMLTYHNNPISRKIYTKLNILFNTILYGQGVIRPQEKDKVKSQIYILNSSLMILTRVLNEQTSFSPIKKKKIKDVVAFYNTESLKIERLKMERHNRLKRDLRRKDEFEEKIFRILSEKEIRTLFGNLQVIIDPTIRKNLANFKRHDSLKYEYLLSILYNLYKILENYSYYKKYHGEYKNPQWKNLHETLKKNAFLTYEDFKTKLYLPEETKEKILKKYFEKIKNTEYVMDPFLISNLKKIPKMNYIYIILINPLEYLRRNYKSI